MAVTLSACEAGAGEESARAVSVPGVPSVPTPATPASAPAPGPPASPPPSTPMALDGGLAPGVEGEAVRLLQDRLMALRYDAGAPDGRYQAETTHAVMAFQKVAGLPATGVAGPDTMAALNIARDPAPLLSTGGATRVEVDLVRQVLFFYDRGVLSRILPVSTGNGKRYCSKGRCGVAVTPSGSYRVYRKLTGKRVSHLGVLYNPLYFKGGFAIHGAPSVPAHPASHGCVRIPMHSSRAFLDAVPRGTPIYLVGGKHPAPPFPPEA